MQDFDASLEDAASSEETRESLRQRLRDFLTFLFKRLVLMISFGPGILGVLWILGRIFIKR